ncbi:MAG TPA: Ig-like domain-containing protein [Nitrososphaerales archaeon]|nr:Ig-like domain-containing protein [Nitrososphaerales archaeon]
MRYRTRARKGVSEVVGALLLILVVVTAVASLAYFVSAAQAQAQARSSFLTNLQNDDLQTVYATFAPNDPTIQWEIDSTSPGSCALTGYTATSWYVQQILSNTGEVNLIPQEGPGSPVAGVTINTGHSYASISKEVKVSLASGAPATLSFGTGSLNCAFEPATWGSITLTIRNQNTQASSLQGVQIDGAWQSTWYQVDQSGNVLSTLGVTKNPLPISAKASVNILLNRTTFGSNAIVKNDSATIALLSGVGNYFPTTFSQPTPIPKFSTTSQVSQATTLDQVTFEGSQSYAATTSIQSFEWKFDIPNAAYRSVNGCNAAATAAFANQNDYDTAYAAGETVAYSPEGLFPDTLGDCIAGPIRATLIVTDSNGLVTTSQPIVVSPDPNIDPVGSISARDGTPPCASPCTVTVTVDDAFGNPVGGSVVNAVKVFGDVSPNLPSQTTTSSGTAQFMVTFTAGGSMNFETGSLLPAQLSFP